MNNNNKEISDHISGQFSAALDEMRDLMLKMGGLAEERVVVVVKALGTRDIAAAKKVVKSDYQINALEMAVDEECMNILALRQPVARDLRMVIAVLKIITDLERVGDEAQKIARQIIELGQVEFPASVQQELNKLGDHACLMLKKALDGFARSQVEVLKELKDQDRQVDEEYNAVEKSLLNAVSEYPEDVAPLLSALWCARSFERIGDHAKNIGEYVVYLVEGKDIRHPA